MSNVQIPTSVRNSFAHQKRVADLLKAEFDQLLNKRPGDWHVTSRVKSEDSFVEKLQTGRVRDQNKMEDMFAATIVVPNRPSLAAAETFVRELMVVDERRPAVGPIKSEASNFRFDDIRLYGHLRAPEDLPVGPIHEMTFEVQVKTFMQHAWAVATHDTVYKTDRTSWARSRMAYQIRALLEHAESAVDAIDVYDASPNGVPVGVRELRLQSIIDFIVQHWDRDFLPVSLIRAGENLDSLCEDLKVSVPDFLSAMSDEISTVGPPLGWSPYQVALHVASARYPDQLRQHLIRGNQKSRVYYVTGDILERLGLSSSDAPNART